MKLLSILLMTLGFQFSFASEAPVNSDEELRAASPELMKLLEESSRAETKKEIQIPNETAGKDLELSKKTETN